MRSRFVAFEVAAAAALFPGFMVMPAIAADPWTPDNSASDAASNPKPSARGREHINGADSQRLRTR